MAIIVKEVETKSFAEVIGIKKKDIILKINDVFVEDFLDLNFFGAEAELTIEFMRNKKKLTLKGKKTFEEALGIEIDHHHCRECVNNCIFCFIDQMPKGMRQTLYVKDDDYSYSFVYGNYVTLTNMSPQKLDKLIQMKISPLYISVHSTNSKLRKEMMRYKQDFDIMAILKKLAENGINYHTQLVLVPGLNDGLELEKSLTDLSSPDLATLGIGVVPVGLTKHRQGLKELPLFTQEESEKVIMTINKYREDFPYIYASDEFYIKADLTIPQAEYYGSFDEIENGIGMVRMLLDNWQYEKEAFANFILTEVKEDLLFVTGFSAQKYIMQIADELNSLISPFKAEVQVIKNRFMGETVTVCGLLSFSDIKSQINLRDNQIPLFSKDIFNSDGLTLDNFDSDSIKKELARNIVIISPMFEDWVMV